MNTPQDHETFDRIRRNLLRLMRERETMRKETEQRGTAWVNPERESKK